MLEFANYGALGVSLVSFCLSLASILIHYAKRGENPLTAHLEMQIDALRLGQTDLIDRVDQWTKRDRTRRAREQVETTPEPASPEQAKAFLRQRAREVGALR
jgi:ABC-type transport system involved in cytochrome bd biosynthesis fused ATPase/permease subunit